MLSSSKSDSKSLTTRPNAKSTKEFKMLCDGYNLDIPVQSASEIIEPGIKCYRTKDYVGALIHFTLLHEAKLYIVNPTIIFYWVISKIRVAVDRKLDLQTLLINAFLCCGLNQPNELTQQECELIINAVLPLLPPHKDSKKYSIHDAEYYKEKILTFFSDNYILCKGSQDEEDKKYLMVKVWFWLSSCKQDFQSILVDLIEKANSDTKNSNHYQRIVEHLYLVTCLSILESRLEQGGLIKQYAPAAWDKVTTTLKNKPKFIEVFNAKENTSYKDIIRMVTISSAVQYKKNNKDLALQYGGPKKTASLDLKNLHTITDRLKPILYNTLLPVVEKAYQFKRDKTSVALAEYKKADDAITLDHCFSTVLLSSEAYESFAVLQDMAKVGIERSKFNSVITTSKEELLSILKFVHHPDPEQVNYLSLEQKQKLYHSFIKRAESAEQKKDFLNAAKELSHARQYDVDAFNTYFDLNKQQILLDQFLKAAHKMEDSARKMKSVAENVKVCGFYKAAIQLWPSHAPLYIRKAYSDSYGVDTYECHTIDIKTWVCLVAAQKRLESDVENTVADAMRYPLPFVYRELMEELVCMVNRITQSNQKIRYIELAIQLWGDFYRQRDRHLFKQHYSALTPQEEKMVKDTFSDAVKDRLTADLKEARRLLKQEVQLAKPIVKASFPQRPKKDKKPVDLSPKPVIQSTGPSKEEVEQYVRELEENRKKLLEAKKEQLNERNSKRNARKKQRKNKTKIQNTAEINDDHETDMDNTTAAASDSVADDSQTVMAEENINTCLKNTASSNTIIANKLAVTAMTSSTASIAESMQSFANRAPMSQNASVATASQQPIIKDQPTLIFGFTLPSLEFFSNQLLELAAKTNRRFCVVGNVARSIVLALFQRQQLKKFDNLSILTSATYEELNPHLKNIECDLVLQPKLINPYYPNETYSDHMFKGVKLASYCHSPRIASDLTENIFQCDLSVNALAVEFTVIEGKKYIHVYDKTGYGIHDLLHYPAIIRLVGRDENHIVEKLKSSPIQLLRRTYYHAKMCGAYWLPDVYLVQRFLSVNLDIFKKIPPAILELYIQRKLLQQYDPAFAYSLKEIITMIGLHNLPTNAIKLLVEPYITRFPTSVANYASSPALLMAAPQSVATAATAAAANPTHFVP